MSMSRVVAHSRWICRPHHRWWRQPPSHGGSRTETGGRITVGGGGAAESPERHRGGGLMVKACWLLSCVAVLSSSGTLFVTPSRSGICNRQTAGLVVFTLRQKRQVMKAAKRMRVEYPCRICMQECYGNQNCICCEGCTSWLHTDCIHKMHNNTQ